MCGIFGCIGKNHLIDDTLNGLKILEYRGYDSAGICYPEGKQIKVIKAVGEMSCLINKINARPQVDVCLGHTRWATNGPVNEKNSHPHLSHNHEIAVVHNGIIENYQALKEQLIKQNIILHTDVDTEIIPNILCLLRHKKHNIHDYLEGQYAFAAYDKTQPQTIFVAKKGNLPLYIGRTSNTFYIASDTLAFPPTVKQIITLNDGDSCEITTTDITHYHFAQPIKKNWQDFNQSFIASDKNGYTTYMEKEIHEIPLILKRIIDNYLTPTITTLLHQWQNYLKSTDCVHICACGTSYHAALIIANLMQKYLKIRAIAHVSSEFTADCLLDTHNLAIVISQSGETADTLACMDRLESHNVPIVALCNVTSSTIAARSKLVFPLLCGPEIAVASTKVFCAALLVGCFLINKFNADDLTNLPSLAQTVLQNTTNIPIPTKRPKQIFCIGKGLHYYLALESALKIKEVTYTPCEGLPAHELKHGPLAMVDPDTWCLVYPGDTANAINEITARGGKVVELPTIAPTNPLAIIPEIITAQIFALRFATQLGINPDKPRNLAKSVTVL